MSLELRNIGKHDQGNKRKKKDKLSTQLSDPAAIQKWCQPTFNFI